MTFVLRRRAPWLVAVVVLAEQSVVLRGRDAGWVGDALWGQETIGIAQVLVLPVIAAATAVDGWRAREGMLSLLGSGAPRWRHVVGSLASWWVPVTIAYLVSQSVVIVLSARADLHVANASGWPAATQVLGAWACCCAGFALGYWARSWTGAVAAASLFVVLPMLGRMGTLPNGFDEFSASGSMLGAAANPRFFAARAAWLVVVGLLSLLLVAWVGARARMGGLGALVVAAVLGLSFFATDRSYATVASRAYCSPTAIVMCGPADLRHRVDEGGRIATGASAALKSLGVSSRHSYVMWSAETDGQDTVMLVNPGRFRDPLALPTVIEGVVAPKSCAFWTDPTGPPPARVFTAVALLDGAVESIMTGMPPTGAYRRFRESVPPGEQAGVLARTGQALQSCRPQAIDARFDGPQWG